MLSELKNSKLNHNKPEVGIILEHKFYADNNYQMTIEHNVKIRSTGRRGITRAEEQDWLRTQSAV